MMHLPISRRQWLADRLGAQGRRAGIPLDMRSCPRRARFHGALPPGNIAVAAEVAGNPLEEEPSAPASSHAVAPCQSLLPLSEARLAGAGPGPPRSPASRRARR